MSQVLAIASVRFKSAMRRARGATGVINAIAAVATVVVGLLFSVMMAAAFGVLVWGWSDEPDRVRFVHLAAFYLCFALGLILPVLQGAMEQGLDVRPFRAFPISRARLYGITLAAAFLSTEHVLYYPALAAVAAATALSGASSPLAVAGASALLLVFFVSWGFAVNLTLAEITRGRRAKEIISVVVFLLLIAAAFSPQLVLDRGRGGGVEGLPYLPAVVRAVARASVGFPPQLAADAMHAARSGTGGGVAGRIAGLALWDAAGIGLGYWIFTRYYLGDRARGAKRARPGRGPERQRRRELWSFDHPWLAAIPIETRAVAAKELRYMLRSVTGRFVLLVVPLFVLVSGGVFADMVDRPVLGIDPERVLLYGMLLYSTVLSNNFLNNAYAWERDGVKSYFISPVPLQRVILGKNLGVWLFNAIVLGVALVCWTALMGFPGAVTAISAALLFAIALIVFTTSGNILSILFPVPRDMSSMMNTPSHTAVLFSLVSLAVGVSLGGLTLVGAGLLGIDGLVPLFLALTLAAVVALYALGLRVAARLLAERRDRLIRALRPQV